MLMIVEHVDVLTLAVPPIGPSYGPARESVLYWKPSHPKQRAASLWTVVTSLSAEDRTDQHACKRFARKARRRA